MATFIAATAFDMMDFISNGSLGELFNFGEVVTETSDTFTLDYVDELKSERLTLLGTFADYVDGFPTSGTITDAVFSLNGSPLFNLTGVSMPASQFTTFVQADDILGLFQALLAGADQVTGSAGDDVLFAYEGNDSINGGGGNDLLDGGDGNDVIDGGVGRDQLVGGAGDDTLVISTPPIAGEVFDGGEGVDTLDVRATAGFVANTAFGPISRVNFGATTLSSIERIQFGSTAETSLAVSVRFDQIGAGLSATAELVGSAGHDQINVIATVAGTYTAPTFTYTNWEGNVDPLVFADQLALIAGGPGDFTLNASEGHAGTQILAGGAGNDVLNGTDGSELLTGGAGVNMLNAGGGTDLLIAANVTPFGGATTNLTYQGNVFDGGDGFDRLSVGGFVNFQGTLVSIEGIHFQPAFTATMPGTQSQQGAELEIDVANLPVDLSLSGQGVLSVNVSNGTGYDASQWLHEAGSNVAVEFFGTSASESFVGTSGNDRFSGGFGSDVFTGGTGSDQFEAGDGQHVATDFTIGEDRVDLQDMNFTSFEQLVPYLSQVGADVVFSRLFGGVAQTMTLRNVALGDLTAASFVFQTGNDDDTRIGTDQADELFGAFGNDTLEGQAGDDYLFAGAGNDTLRGGLGNDRLYGGAGNDFLSEASGDNGPFGDDLYDGGDGIDRVSLFTAFGPGVTVDLRLDTAQNTGSMGTDTFVGIEHVTSNHGDDTLIGNDATNWFWTFSGTDNLSGNGGDDYFTVGKGDKTVDGGSGVDTIDIFDTAFEPAYTAAGIAVSLALQGSAQATGTGNWTLTGIENLGGSFGADRLTGDANANILAGAEGDDTLIGGDGDDILSGDGAFDIGADGVPTFIATPTAPDWAFGNDVLEGGAGNDTLNGAAGNDTLRGGLGNDQLFGGTGNDFLTEGSGDNGPFGDDLYDGGEGSDRVSLFTDFGPGATVDLRITTAQNTGMGNDTFVGIEHITATYNNDTLTGNDAANWFWTFNGTDVLAGMGGDDLFTVGLGDKVVDGGDGVDTVEVADLAFQPLYTADGITVSLALQGAAQATGIGNWTLANVENLSGFYGSDDFTGDANANFLAGAEGDDTLRGGDGNDTLSGDGTFGLNTAGELAFFEDGALENWAFGNDVLEGGAGDDTLDGGRGNDTLRGGLGNDRLYGGDGNDFLSEASGDNGPFGDDLYDGGAGSDRVSMFTAFGPGITVDLRMETAQNTGSMGTDTFVGIEHITANYGDDTLIGNDADNWFWTFSGTDNLTGNGGNDYFTVGSGDKVADGGTGIDTIEIAEFALTPVYTAEGITVSLALQGTAQVTGAGTWTITDFENLGGFSGSDELTGDDNANILAGGLGGDTLVGGGGNDTLAGDGTFIFQDGAQQFVENNTVDGPGGNDTLVGGAGDDRLIGGGGDDLLDGGEGNDFMVGGTGNDVYVAGLGDGLVEEADGGIDEVRTDLDWGLGDHLEKLTATGTANVFLGGNALDNALTGNSGDNYLVGEGGSDMIDGGAGRDVAAFRLPASTTGTLRVVEGPDGTLLVQLVQADDSFEDLFSVAPGTGGSATVTGLGSMAGLGTDTVANIEELHFFVDTFPAPTPAGQFVSVPLVVTQFETYVAGSASDDVINMADYPGATGVGGSFGNDTITGGSGADYIRGEAGNDLIDGGGNDQPEFDVAAYGLPAGMTGSLRVVAGTGDDAGKLVVERVDGETVEALFIVSFTEAGVATVQGVNSAAFLGTDIVTNVNAIDFTVDNPEFDPAQFAHIIVPRGTTSGDDVINGGSDSDAMFGAAGNDTLRGGLGNDQLFGGTGNDFLTEGSGDNGPFGDDLYDGGEGSDRVSLFTDFGPGATVDLRITTAQNTGMGNDTFVGIEHITATYNNDTLTGNDAANWFWTFNGTDVLAGMGGDDLFTVGLGDKVVDGGDGVDTVEVADLAFQPLYTADGITVSLALQGAAQATGIGNWTLANVENLSGFYGSDDFTGDANANFLAGAEGDDTLRGGDGNDTLSGDGTFGLNTAGELAFFEDGALENWAFGNDVLEGGAGDDTLNGGRGNDLLDGGEGNDMLRGGAGNDVYVVGLGDAFIENEDEGVDELRTAIDWGLGDNFENLTATGSANIFLGGNALGNVLTGNGGDNYLVGEGGNDLLDGGAGRDVAAFRLPADTTGTLRVVDGPDGTLLVQLVQADGSFEDVFSVTLGAAGSASVTGLGSMAGIGTDTVANIEELHFVVDTFPTPTPAGQFVSVPLVVARFEDFVAGSASDDVIDMADYPGATGVGGSFGDDTITGGSGADYIRGDAGNDLIDGGGNDQAGFDVAAYGLPAGTTGSLRVVAGTGTHAGNLVVERVDGDIVEALFIVSFTEAGVASVQGVNSAAFLGTDIVTNVNAIDFTVDNPEFDPAQFAHIIVPRGTTSGNDVLFGGASSDAMLGGDGHDFLRGNAGDDLIYAGNGDDFLVGGAGNDLLDGGAGIDRVAYGAAAAGVTVDLGLEGVAQVTGMGTDTLVGIEHVTGGSFDDVLTGNGGDNWLWGITGNDTISGGDGDDLAEIGSGNSMVDGGAGNDTLLTNGNVAGAVTIALALQGAAQDTGQGMMTLSRLENLSGSQFNDQLSGDAAANILGGDEGDDWLIGGGGDDMLYGDGAITIDSHDLGGSGPIQWIEDGAIFAIPGGNDTLEGGAGDDRLVGGGGDDVLDGGEGNDTLRGGSGGDVLTGGAGNDVYDYSFGANGIDGDTITELDVGDVIDLRSNGLDSGGSVLCTTFIGASAFSGAAGEYRYQISGTQTLVEVDSDGDGIADSVLTIANGAFILSETAPGSNMLGLGADIDPLAGIVADGYVEGATLFVDTNGNKQLDSGEAWTVTGPGGIFSLNVNQAGTIVALGGVNADTGLANTMTLVAPSSSGVVNPLTTLITAVVDAGAGATSLAEAEAQVKQALGLDPTLDLLNLDLLGQGSDPAALAAQKAAAMIANLVSTTEAVPGAGSGSEATVVGALAQLVGGNTTVDLTSTATLTDLLTEALPGVQDIGAIANEVSSDGQKIAAATSIAEVSEAQVEAQFTGNSLNNVISGNEGGNVLSGLGGDDTLLGLDGNDTLIGGAGQDQLTGGSGADVFSGSLAELNGDTIADFKVGDRIVISDASAANFAFTFANGTLSFGGASISLLGVHPGANLLVTAAAGGGVELAIQPQFGGTALITTAFGSGPAAGGWSTNDQYPREMADVNGDGRADIVGFGNDGVYVALSTVDGTFANPVLATTAFGAAAGAGGWSSDDRYPRQLADVNGDGRDDVVGFGNDGVYVSLAAANGTFGAPILATTAFGAGAGAGGWASDDQYPRHLADVNGDGRADVVGFGNDGVYVSLAAADGTFAAPILATTAFGAGASAGGWSSQDAYARQLADVNGDGRADIVGFGNSGAYVSIAAADGSFAAPILGLDEFGASAEAGGWSSDDRNPRMLGDIDGDGKMDIVGFGGEGVFIALGKGDGTFEKTMLDLGFFGADPAAGGWDSADIFPRHLADVNHDGAADIVGFASTGVYVAFSNGDIWL